MAIGQYSVRLPLPGEKELPWESAWGGVPIVPGLSRLHALPPRAVAAFAVRCARRVRPYFESAYPDTPWMLPHVMDNILDHAEAIAEGRQGFVRTYWPADALHTLADVAFKESYRYRQGSRARLMLVAAGNIFSAALAADPAVSQGLIGGKRDKSPESYRGHFHAFAADRAARAAAIISPIASTLWRNWRTLRPHCITHVRADFNTLEDLTRAGRLGPDDPVPQSLFGPLWGSNAPICKSLSPADRERAPLRHEPVLKLAGSAPQP